MRQRRPPRQQQTEAAQKRHYDRVKALLSYTPLLLVASFLLAVGESLKASLLAAALCICVCAFSGYASWLHWKLPKKYQEKPSILAFRSLDIHPYVAFVLFAVCSLLLLGSCIMIYRAK